MIWQGVCSAYLFIVIPQFLDVYLVEEDILNKKIKKYVGGQAVIEGVMMRGPKVTATAVREPGGNIIIDEFATTSITDKYKILKKPFIRGSIALWESLSIGMKALAFSAKVAGEEEEELTDKEIVITMLLAGLVAVGLFIVVPTYAAKWIPYIQNSHFILNMFEGFVRLILFLLYIWGISRMPDIKRVFEYHGAEHKTIHTYEKNEELTVENVRKNSRIHPRCGTNFLMIVMVVSIIVFAFLGWPNLIERITSRIVLLPVVAGIAYEIIRLAGCKDNIFIRIIIAPGLWLQKLTTLEPQDDQIEVAIAALQAVRPNEEEAYE